ncbi:MAG: large-conductance mechanosensitive channel protein MscL [Chitinophagales bacterium]|nr:large-conductance mechanosensitive channel protein MscL [Chitinophagales bacterium]
MSMMKEFKEFAMKGNLVDMAVAFVMGGAFGKVVSSFIDGIVMPPISLLWGGNLEGKIVLRDAVAAVTDAAGTVTTPEVPEVAITYGAFISALISFIIVAFVMFMIVKAVNKTKKVEEAAPTPPSAEETLLTEIRDLLKK